jgi:hypothetical protein
MLGPAFSFQERATVVSGPLSPLAASLAADLDRLLPDEDVFIPAEKARMTRRGGRCATDGAFLEFDPRQPRRHRCPVCGTIHDREEDYRWWIMGYQLWLSERTVHAAALWRLTRNPRYRGLAEAILRKLAGRYTSWPNEDNVLGPTRVFFSTYLESIWSLQLSVAVWLLEDGGDGGVGQLVRESILAPSSELVASFDEGMSNRQVWNNAALGAAGILLGRPAFLERALVGGSGLHRFLRTGLQSDGSWYEGENYHLFAHRGLWYLVMLAERARASIPDELMQRFVRGFAAPLKTALPDFTFPARRDSQYKASLRQWRMAESLELGLARSPDSTELAAGLTTIYGDAPGGDSARWRSTGEAERNVPGVRLTRADLGWKSLLFALPAIEQVAESDQRSALMEGQGYGVIRRERGRVYAALDYGHTGGSHGHPDRLNLWLVLGDRRVFEDVGTGSYVERTLHWYRSTLAHNAPLVDGRSQDMVPGSLRAWDERDGFSWIDAEAAIAEGVLVRRSVVVGPGHIVDRVEWRADRHVTLDLPMHHDGMEVVEGAWSRSDLVGGSGLEDGFDFVSTAERLASPRHEQLVMGNDVNGLAIVDVPHDWWRVKAPGPPGSSERTFLLVRARGMEGRITSVWSWAGSLGKRDSTDDSLDITVGGVRFAHQLINDEWHVESHDGTRTVLAGRRNVDVTVESSIEERVAVVRFIPVVDRDVSIGDLLATGTGLRFELGRAQYRRTEATWEDAGSPTATVMIAATATELLIEVSVNVVEPNFAVAAPSNALDNEHPDTNSAGVQLHLESTGHEESMLAASWLMVPVPSSSTVRVSARDDARNVPVEATWQPKERGWQLLARIQRQAIGSPAAAIGLDVTVNEMPSGRERRRGQLVMGATKPGWAYLRGDRHEREHLVLMTVRHV